ncbi:hypothetical protein BLA29_014161 [Euroglyphus maynei]|uniref:Uncharacterized protein n=1 Tax=Euroglyphus maynei TaxID=6958 RepID=A0A1Y3AMN1_EURMA|nr:hypothetical protein BLA29_014161 [Euroglyphus maynei]
MVLVLAHHLPTLYRWLRHYLHHYKYPLIRKNLIVGVGKWINYSMENHPV